MTNSAVVLVLGHNLHIDQIKYHSHESGHPRNRVDLRRRKIRPELSNKTRKKRCLCTDQYRPSVRLTPPNDTPFVVKSGDELPSRGRGSGYCCEACYEAGDGTPVQTHM
jgi:hypothetical protein